ACACPADQRARLTPIGLGPRRAISCAISAASRLTPISHIVEVHRGPESEKVVLRQQLSFDRGTSRCKQSVAQNDLILHLLKSAPLWPALTAERSPPTPARFCWGWRTGLSEWLIALPAASWTSAM